MMTTCGSRNCAESSPVSSKRPVADRGTGPLCTVSCSAACSGESARTTATCCADSMTPRVRSANSTSARLGERSPSTTLATSPAARSIRASWARISTPRTAACICANIALEAALGTRAIESLSLRAGATTGPRMIGRATGSLPPSTSTAGGTAAQLHIATTTTIRNIVWQGSGRRSYFNLALSSSASAFSGSVFIALASAALASAVLPRASNARVRPRWTRAGRRGGGLASSMVS